jgi:hypothetical protein
MAKRLSVEEQNAALKDLKSACYENGKIHMIKACRQIAGNELGLAEAKKLVEDCMERQSSAVKPIPDADRLYDDIVSELSRWLRIEFSKEQFLQIVAEAYDTAGSLYTDPLEAVLIALENLKKKGGLVYAAQKAQEFIDKI